MAFFAESSVGFTSDPEFIVAFQVNAEREIAGLVDHLLILTNLEYDTVQINSQVNRILGSRLPFGLLVNQGINYFRD